jgi:hypothetical protein
MTELRQLMGIRQPRSTNYQFVRGEKEKQNNIKRELVGNLKILYFNR